MLLAGWITASLYHSPHCVTVRNFNYTINHTISPLCYWLAGSLPHYITVPTVSVYEIIFNLTTPFHRCVIGWLDHCFITSQFPRCHCTKSLLFNYTIPLLCYWPVGSPLYYTTAPTVLLYKDDNSQTSSRAASSRERKENNGRH